MLGAFGKKISESVGGDIYPGLMGMFIFLHFYYGVPEHGWLKSGLGAAAIIAGTFFVSLTTFKMGNGFRTAAALITTALAFDFFYRGQAGNGAKHLIFEYLGNGPAAVNFASFGLASVWFLSQLDTSS